MRCPTLTELPAPPSGKTGRPWTEESPQLPEARPNGQPWPRVSVVTPSFNQDEFIEETLRSVLLQGYPNLEYLLIDGGSTDGSVDIIRKYESWLAYWVSRPDRGQTHAINKGWAKSTGEILAYINSDDFYLQGALEAAVQGFCERSDAGLVYGAAIVIDPAGRNKWVWRARPFDLGLMLAENNVVPQPAAFFFGSALEKVGYLDEQWHMIMDYELSIRVGMHFPAVCISRALAKFREHTDSKTRRQFDETTRELIHFGTTFFAKQGSLRNMAEIKRATVSRYHYELSLTYIAQGRQYAAKGLKHLLGSIARYPLFALKRPMQTAYLLKEMLLGHLQVIGRWKPAEQIKVQAE